MQRILKMLRILMQFVEGDNEKILLLKLLYQKLRVLELVDVYSIESERRHLFKIIASEDGVRRIYRYIYNLDQVLLVSYFLLLFTVDIYDNIFLLVKRPKLYKSREYNITIIIHDFDQKEVRLGKQYLVKINYKKNFLIQIFDNYLKFKNQFKDEIKQFDDKNINIKYLHIKEIHINCRN